MMCRLLHSIPRGLRHKAQANANHPPWNGNGSQQSRRQEDNIYTGFGAAYLNTESPAAAETRSHHLLTHSRSFDSLVRHTDWKWDGWRSVTGKNHWGSFNGKDSHHTSHDALEWGAALVFSLHLCRAVTAATLPDDSGNGYKKLLSSLADKLPSVLAKPAGALNLVRQQDKEKKAKDESPQEKVPDSPSSAALDVAAAQLQTVTDQSIGQAHNHLGVKQAQEGNPEKAAQHFTEGSKVGFSKATFNLAVCYEQGRGVAQDQEKAADLYLKAAMQGHPQAYYNLGVFHLIGTGGVKQDADLAIKFIHSAAASGVQQANSYLGIHFLNSTEHRDEEKAATFLQKAVTKQDTDAQYHLGLCYENGWGVPMNTAKAASLYHRAAQRSHPAALHSLARFRELGLGGLPVDGEQALELYKQASQEGHQPASEYLQKLQCDPTSDTNRSIVRTNVTSCTDNATKNVPREPLNAGVNSKTLHMSSSAPSLRCDQTKEINNSENQELEYMNKRFSISHLNLLLPYYFNLRQKPALVGPSPSSRQSSQVEFQVGGDDEEGKVDDRAFSIARNGFHGSPQFLTVS